jgi:hypothetical protein
MHNALTTAAFSLDDHAPSDVSQLEAAIEKTAAAIHQGDLRDVEALLIAQAVALNAMFSKMSLLARANMVNLPVLDGLTRLALKAQGQSRATLETIAELRNPSVVFARQANIAHGPQQVNNALVEPGPTEVSVARAANQESERNELMEAHGERLDTGTAGPTIEGYSSLAPVGALDRSPNAGREGTVRPERRPRIAAALVSRSHT